MSTDLLQPLLNSLEAELPRAVLLRERLHASPEPSHQEHETARLVTHGLGTAEVSRVAGTGLVARAGPDALPAVAVRAELDALPVWEETGAPFAATNGLMHACGHDVHMAALAALLRAARRVGGSLPKPLLALYQPSEESHPLGADLVVREGALASTAAIVAAHVHPEVPWGAVSVEPGPVNASLDFLRIVVEGAGGHGAYPHRANDPIFALSNVIVALQSLVSRRLDPMHPGVLTIGWTRAGTTENVIPSRAEAGGTEEGGERRHVDVVAACVHQAVRGGEGHTRLLPHGEGVELGSHGDGRKVVGSGARHEARAGDAAHLRGP